VSARVTPVACRAALIGGEPEYEERFSALARDADRVFRAAGPRTHAITLAGREASAAQVSAALRDIAREAQRRDTFLLLLIGHGSFDGWQYKLNLRGPDLSATQLATLCNAIAAEHQLIVNTTSASGGSVSALVRPGRAVIAATKSGTEKNATVFARYFLDALQDPTADVDKNDAVSALEAFQYATAKTAAFYAAQQRLATEHAVFSDTGTAALVRSAALEQGSGRLLSSLVLVRFGSSRAAQADPGKRQLLERKEQLTAEIDRLKLQRAALSPQEYRQQLTRTLLELARVQRELDR